MSINQTDSSPSIRGLIEAVASLLAPPSFECPPPSETTTLKTGKYERKVDLYVPENPVGALTGTGVLMVHGGGFVMGSRDMKPVRNLTRSLQAGATVVSMDYTLVFRGGTLLRQTAEVRETAQWMRAKLELKTCVGIGLSAGVASLFHSIQGSHPSCFDALVSIYGALDFSDAPSPLIRLVYRNLLGPLGRENWSGASPSRVLQTSEFRAPVLFIHGENDPVCPFATAHDLHAWREKIGLPSELWVAPVLPTVFNRENSENSQEAIRVLLEFLEGIPSEARYAGLIIPPATRTVSRMKTSTSFFPFALFLLLIGCSPALQGLKQSPGATSADAMELLDRVYTSRTLPEMREAHQALTESHPGTPASFESGALLAYMEDDRALEFHNHLQASLFTDSPGAELHFLLAARMEKGAHAAELGSGPPAPVRPSQSTNSGAG